MCFVAAESHLEYLELTNLVISYKTVHKVVLRFGLKQVIVPILV